MNNHSANGQSLDAELIVRALVDSLRAGAFSGTRSPSPVRLKGVGEKMASQFLNYVALPNDEEVLLLGKHLATLGIGPRSLMKATETLSRIGREQVKGANGFTETVNEFGVLLFEGFILGREENLLKEQEQTFQAYLRTQNSS